MGKASLRLLGTYSAWSTDVREAAYTRDGMADVPMLVRVDGPVVTDASMAQARSEVKLLSRLKHDHVLRMDFVSAVAGRIGSVYEHSGGASLSLLIAAEGAAGRSLPLRVCVEIAAAVALALDEATRVTASPARVDHPGPEPRDVLLERTGRPRLAGFVVVTGELARRRGFSPPEERSQHGSPAAMSWMATQFLTDLIRGAGRQSEVPTPLAGAMRAGFSTDPAGRPLPGAYGRLLREVAADLPGPGLRGWAEAPVRDLLVSARSAEAQQAQAAVSPTTRVAPAAPPSAERPSSTTTSSRLSTPSATRSLGPSPTIIPDFETEEPGHAPLSAATIIPEFDPEFETEEPAVDRAATDSRAYALPISVGPSVPPPSPRAEPRLQQPAPTRPVPSLSGLGSAHTALTEIDDSPPPTVRQGPAMGGLPAPGGPQGPAFGGPASPSAAPGPRRIEPARAETGGRVEMRLNGSADSDDSASDDPPESPPTRTGLYIGLATVGLLSILGLLLAGAAVYYYAPGAAPSTQIDAPPPGVDPAAPPGATNDAAAALAEPVAPAPTPAPSTPAATPAPAPAAPTAAPAPAPTAAPAHAKATPPPAAQDEEPSRISASESSARVAPASAPAAQPAPEPAQPAAPEEPGPFDVSFKPAEGDITSLEVRCSSQSGSGMIVELNGVPKATSCKITGIGGAAPLQTLVTINAARSYTCFANGSRSCR